MKSIHRTLFLLFLAAAVSACGPGNVTPGSTTVSRIGTGGSTTFCTKSNNSFWAWGQNDTGQMGDGTNDNSQVPISVAGITTVLSVSGGMEHTLAVKGTDAWSWGGNGYGQLGNNTTTSSNSPAKITALAGVSGVAAGAYHSLALLSTGIVWSWGRNNYGQLGNNTIVNSSVPVQVSNILSVSVIDAGQFHSIVLKSDGGTVWAWGYNGYGQLGNKTTTDSYYPVQVSNIASATSVAAGDLHSMALLNSGTIKAWGFNGYGQLGNGTTTDSNLPVDVSSLSSVSTLCAGKFHSVALKTNGAVWAWGRNNFGQLGDGTTTNRSTPVQVSGMTGGVTAISCGDNYTVVRKSNGVVWAWGQNDYGQLGDGTIVSSSTPVEVSF